jgi:hypothetical protein
MTEAEIVEGGLLPDVYEPPPAPSPQLVRRDPAAVFELDQRRANLYAESGYWPDAKSQAQALVKIEAGRELGLPAITAMSEIHLIQGKPTLGAGALGSLVKTSGRYDYRVVEHTEQRCVIRFFDLQAGELGESVFTLDDARKAGLAGRSTWRQYPRNMLFARALSNGVAWYCPDVSAGRVYTPEELDGAMIVETDLLEGEADEELPADEPPARKQRHDPAADSSKIPPDRRPTGEQGQRLRAVLDDLAELDPDRDWRQVALNLAGIPDWDHASAGMAGDAIEKLETIRAKLLEKAAG